MRVPQVILTYLILATIGLIHKHFVQLDNSCYIYRLEHKVIRRLLLDLFSVVNLIKVSIKLFIYMASWALFYSKTCCYELVSSFG